MAKAFENPRSILITGASSGIGEALALAYAQSGVFLALSGRNEDRLTAVATACRQNGAEVEAVALDVADAPAVTRWVEETDDHRRLDLVIANAGISLRGARRDGGVTRLLAVNIGGVFNTVLPLIPRFCKRRSGQIAIMSSVAGLRGLPSAPAYAASKAAVRSWGEGLRGRLAEDGVGVSVICPGFVESGITAANPFKMPLIMPADKAARIIIRRLARNKPRITFPWQIVLGISLVAALPQDFGNFLMRRIPFKE
jgi:short-subunit dehydrogenase